MIKNKTFSVSYFLGRAFFLGFGFSLLFKLLDKDAWIASLLGVLLGSLFICFFQKKSTPCVFPLLFAICGYFIHF